MTTVSELASEAVRAFIDAYHAQIRTLPVPVFNVKGYGAKGDGSADDTQARDDAVGDAIAKGGGLIYYPYGRYIHSSKLYLPDAVTYSNLIFMGQGRYSQILHTSGDYAFEVGDGVNGPNNIQMENLQITGHSGGSAGVLINASRGQLRNVSVNGYSSTTAGSVSEGGSGIKVIKGHSWDISGCSLGGNQMGIYTATGGAPYMGFANLINIKDRCIIEGNLKYGIYLGGGMTINIENNLIESNADYGIYCDVPTNVNIKGNHFEGHTTESLHLENSAFLSNVNIEGNLFGDFAANYQINAMGCNGLHINGNKFYYPGVTALMHIRWGGYVVNVDIGINDVSHITAPYTYINSDGNALQYGKWYDIVNNKWVYGTRTPNIAVRPMTNAARQALGASDKVQGLVVFETDTNLWRIWSGSDWRDPTGALVAP